MTNNSLRTRCSAAAMLLSLVSALTMSMAAHAEAAAADNPRMIKDVNTLSRDSSSLCGIPVELNGIAYFCGAESQLWKTDGTPAGTQPVKLGDGTIVDYAYGLQRSGRFLYFVRHEQLWRSDGTPRGTLPVKDSHGNVVDLGDYNYDGIDVNGVLFFVASDGALWKTNGTSGGTVMVKTLAEDPNDMAAVNGSLFFTTYEHQLWKSDGTAAGTVMVKDLPGRNVSTDDNNLTSVNGTLFFSLEDDGSQYDLWKSDGTPNGTVMVANDLSDRYMQLSGFRNVAGELYFNVQSNSYRDSAVWRSNGTTAGTRQVALFANAGTHSVAALGNRYVFGGSSNGVSDLWITDGTTAGVVRLVRDVYYAVAAVYNGHLYFTAANDTGLGYELWKTDGTVAGTELVRDIALGDKSSSPHFFAATSAGMLFQANKGKRYGGNALWISQGTASTTKLVKDISQFTAGSYPSAPTVVGNQIFFLANKTGSPHFGYEYGYHGAKQWELWKTDGSSAGTQLVLNLIKDKTHGNENFGAEYAALVNFDGKLYVSGRDSFGWGLWRTDGTPAGTEKMLGVLPNGSTAIMTQLTVYNDKLFFFAATAKGVGLWRLGPYETTATLIQDGLIAPRTLTAAAGKLAFINNNAQELWRSDGSKAGTYKVKSLSLAADAVIDRLQSFDDRLIFRAQWNEDPDNDGRYHDYLDSALWISDGTEAGTYPLADYYPNDNSYLGDVLVIDKRIMFSNYEGLWISDGTLLGTQRIAEVAGMPTNVNGTVYFSGAGDALWKTDGTAAGTTVIKSGLYFFGGMANINGELYFSAFDTLPGWSYNEDSLSLRKSDGTASGTVPVKPGLILEQSLEIPHRSIFTARARNERGYYEAAQIWLTDGTDVGTRQISNIQGDIVWYDQFPKPLFVNNQLFLVVDGFMKGAEPWVFDPN